MHFSHTVLTITLAFVARGVITAPLPQLAGFGAACDSLLSSTDNGIGYGIEHAEDNTANLITTVKGTTVPAVPIPDNSISDNPVPGAKRQLAGEGAACDSVLSSTDDGVGYGIKNAETNTANLITSVRPAGVPRRRRQLDKIADGAGAIGGALGVGAVTGPPVGEADTLDGQSTGDAALLGQQAGDDEATTLENAGDLVP